MEFMVLPGIFRLAWVVGNLVSNSQEGDGGEERRRWKEEEERGGGCGSGRGGRGHFPGHVLQAFDQCWCTQAEPSWPESRFCELSFFSLLRKSLFLGTWVTSLPRHLSYPQVTQGSLCHVGPTGGSVGGWAASFRSYLPGSLLRDGEAHLQHR